MPLIYNRSIIRKSFTNLVKHVKEKDETFQASQNLIEEYKDFSIKRDSKSDMDLVYIVKPGEINTDLRYSLRSVSKFCRYKSIWIVGFKPAWVQNVKYLLVNQTLDKWKNSMLNYIAACECPNISDDFVLMNDDFFAIHPVEDWHHDCNVYLGELQEYVDRFSGVKTKSKWQYGFEYAVKLLADLKCITQYNYESHTSFIINKKKFLEMLNLPEIVEICSTKKVLHKRSVYKNLYPDNLHNLRKLSNDVKLSLYKDLDTNYFKENWISTYDDTIYNDSFPKLNYLLLNLFSKPCQYERP